MAVKGKKRYVLYLDENTTEFVKSYLETTKNKGGLSLLVDKYLGRTAIVIKKHENLTENVEATKLSIPTIFKIFKDSWKKEREHKSIENNKDKL